MLGKLGGDWGWLIGNKVLQGRSGDIAAEEISLGFLLSKLGGDWGWLVGNKVLQGRSGDVASEKITLDLSELGGDWGWLVSDEVLQGRGGDVAAKKITFDLSELGGDWGWLVSDEILQGRSRDIAAEKISSHQVHVVSIQLNETLGDWGIRVSDQVHKSLLGDVLTVELTNEGGWVWLLVLPVGNLIIWAVVSIIVWETLVKSLRQGLVTVVWVPKWGWGKLLWDSLDHHADSDVVVIRWIFLLISVLLQDGVEGIISNNLSETLESNRFNSIEVISWRNLQGDGLDLINWDVNWHGILIEIILSLGLDKVVRGWCIGMSNDWGSLLLSLHEGLWSMLVMLLSLLVMVLLVRFVSLY